MPKRTANTRDIAHLYQLYRQGELELAPEYQRNSVWPRAAKAYLIDTILNEKPITLFFLKRIVSAQTGTPKYQIIDGQQRLRAIFEFLEDGYKLSQSPTSTPYYNKKYSILPREHQSRILNYDLTIEELSGYDEEDIEDMFVRMNRFVVRLSPQELRHARESGAFRDLVESIGGWDEWMDWGVFSPLQVRRMRNVEFAAELVILLVEGAQDKKKAIDLYYRQYSEKCPFRAEVEKALKAELRFIHQALPNISKSRFRKPVDLYSLIGALEKLRFFEGLSLKADEVGKRLRNFEKSLSHSKPPADSTRYLIAASRQTDNLIPRNTRMSVIVDLLSR
jgi:hypothetical protein